MNMLVMRQNNCYNNLKKIIIKEMSFERNKKKDIAVVENKFLFSLLLNFVELHLFDICVK